MYIRRSLVPKRNLNRRYTPKDDYQYAVKKLKYFSNTLFGMSIGMLIMIVLCVILN